MVAGDNARRRLGVTNTSTKPGGIRWDSSSMTPENQDAAAIKSLGACGVLDRIKAGNDSWITNSCVGGTWASFPVNSYGQPQKSAATLAAKWQEFQAKYK